ncbi:hypothetical protein FACS189492_2700 [Clostridia bacterium]|nr:hypothetical protein FACS189492_2700 [Clostridia bacterium]
MGKLFSKLRLTKKKVIITAVIVVLAAGGTYTYLKLGKKTTADATNYLSAQVTRGPISKTISGSGTIEPVSRYEIVSLVSGEILSCPYEEGDSVRENDILYRIDSTDVQNNIQKQNNSYSNLQLNASKNAENIAKCKVYAPASGVLTNFTVKVNDTVRDDVGSIIDNAKFVATIPFTASQAAQIKTGDRATVTSALYMTTLDGVVSHVSNATTGSSGGSALCNVEITIGNPGALTSGVSVGATAHTASGDLKSPASGTIQNADETSIKVEVSGKVRAVHVKNGEQVKKGDLILEIDDTDYRDAQRKASIDLQDAALSRETLDKQLEKYNIKSPINGVVLTKNSKAGDTLGNGSGNSNTVLMTVADTSSMVFNLDVDELDISKIAVGQTAKITADAIAGAEFTGYVTKVSKEGTSSNGVTTYKTELTIYEPGDLISGMNVNAEIIVESNENALLLPVAAVSNVRNGVGTVMVKAGEAPQGVPGGQTRTRGDGTTPPAEGQEGQTRTRGDGATPPADGQEGQTRTRGDGTTPPAEGQEGQTRTRGDGATPPAEGQEGQTRTRGDGATPPVGGTAPGGQTPASTDAGGAKVEYVRVRVTVGITNSDSVEILSGLNEGQTVYYAATVVASGNNANFMMGGAPMGGGAPGGGQVRVQSAQPSGGNQSGANRR